MSVFGQEKRQVLHQGVHPGGLGIKVPTITGKAPVDITFVACHSRYLPPIFSCHLISLLLAIQ